MADPATAQAVGTAGMPAVSFPLSCCLSSVPFFSAKQHLLTNTKTNKSITRKIIINWLFISHYASLYPDSNSYMIPVKTSKNIYLWQRHLDNFQGKNTLNHTSITYMGQIIYFRINGEYLGENAYTKKLFYHSQLPHK